MGPYNSIGISIGSLKRIGGFTSAAAGGATWPATVGAGWTAATESSASGGVVMVEGRRGAVGTTGLTDLARCSGTSPVAMTGSCGFTGWNDLNLTEGGEGGGAWLVAVSRGVRERERGDAAHGS
jgi:hypothetical protein